MKIDKTKLLQDIKAMKEKLASMEKELNKLDEFKHFPSENDKYYYYVSSGVICSNTASNDDLKVNVYKTWLEAKEACDKAFALEKIKRRLLELQGDWKPNWKDNNERKVQICYKHSSCEFEPVVIYSSQSFKDTLYIANIYIANIIIKEMEDELKLIFNIA